MVEKKNIEMATELRRDLHAHPELSMEEVWTKKHLIEFLKENTSLEVVDKGLWFYAVYRSPVGKRNIAYRADYDALRIVETITPPWASQTPGLSHKCGHDGHAAALAGFALEVDQKGSDNNIFFLFQPGEEDAQGAILCREMIAENNIDEIFGYHNVSGAPENTVVIHTGTANCASVGMRIHFQGTSAHASQPENGKNPSLAIAEVIQAIPGIIRPDKYEGLVLCTVVHVNIGTENYGISASSGILCVTCRGEYEQEMEAVMQALREVCEAAAEKAGLTVDYHYQDAFPETVNHDSSVAKVKAACAVLGIPVADAPAPSRGSEDFGWYTKEIPGAIFYVGNGEDYPPVHTFEYDFPDVIIPTAMAVFAELAGMEK